MLSLTLLTNSVTSVPSTLSICFEFANKITDGMHWTASSLIVSWQLSASIWKPTMEFGWADLTSSSIASEFIE